MSKKHKVCNAAFSVSVFPHLLYFLILLVFYSFLCSLNWMHFCSFKLILKSKKTKTKTKHFFKKCRKRSILSSTSTYQQHFTACKIEPSDTNSVGFKITATFIFPFKAFGTNNKKKTTLYFYGCLLKSFPWLWKALGFCHEEGSALDILYFLKHCRQSFKMA